MTTPLSFLLPIIPQISSPYVPFFHSGIKAILYLVTVSSPPVMTSPLPSPSRETEAGTRLSGVGALSHATAIRSVDMRARIKMKTLDFFIIAPIIIPLIANRIREAL